MEPLDYNQQMKFLQLYNAAIEAQALEARQPPLLRQTSRSSLNLDPWDPHKVDHDRIRYPPPLKRANSSGQLYDRRRSIARAASAESGYNSSSDHRYGRLGNPPAPRRSVSASDTYEGYPRIRRVSVVQEESDIRPRASTPPIIKRKKTSVNSIRSSGSVSPSVRFSTVEDLISAYNHGAPWSGRYKPRLSVSSERDSYVSAHSVVDMQEEHIVRPPSAGRRSSSSSRKGSADVGSRPHSAGSHRRESGSGRRTSTSSRHGSERSSRRASSTDSKGPSRRDSTTSRRSSVASRRSSVGSRRSSIDSRRLSIGSTRSRRESVILDPNGMEGAELMRRLSSAGGNLKEWERSVIMRRRSSERRRSSVGDSNSSSSDSDSDSSSGSDSEDDSSSSSGSGTTSGSSSGSSSDSGSDSGSNSDDSDDEEGEAKPLQNHVNSSSSKYVAGNNNFTSANGKGHMTQNSRGNGAVAMATDGQNGAYNNNYGRRESKSSSSSMCIIL